MTLFRSNHRSSSIVFLAACFFVIQREVEDASVLDRQPLQFAEFAFKNTVSRTQSVPKALSVWETHQGS